MIGLPRRLRIALAACAYYRVGLVRETPLDERLGWRARFRAPTVFGVLGIGAAEAGRGVDNGTSTCVDPGQIHSARTGRYCSIGPNVATEPNDQRLDHWRTSCYEELAADKTNGYVARPRPAPTTLNGTWTRAHVVLLRSAALGARSVIAGSVVLSGAARAGGNSGDVLVRALRKLAAISLDQAT